MSLPAIASEWRLDDECIEFCCMLPWSVGAAMVDVEDDRARVARKRDELEGILMLPDYGG